MSTSVNDRRPNPCEEKPCKEALDAYWSALMMGQIAAGKLKMLCHERDRLSRLFMQALAAIGVSIALYEACIALHAPQLGWICSVLLGAVASAFALAGWLFMRLNRAFHAVNESRPSCEKWQQKILEAYMLAQERCSDPACYGPPQSIDCSC